MEITKKNYLETLKSVLGHSILHCLCVLRNLSGTETERLPERIINILKDCGLNITIKMNLKPVDFLDFRLDLVNNTYQPYRKPNNEPVYIHKQSNLPPNILKEFPKSINKLISDMMNMCLIIQKNIRKSFRK